MPVNVIDTIKPKNNGTFPVVEAVDVEVSESLRLPEALAAKADTSALEETVAAVERKANADDVQSVTDNLQAQINQIITPVTEDAEVQNARVGSDGTTYSTLKERCDTENTEVSERISNLRSDLTELEDNIPSISTEEDLSESLQFVSGKYISYPSGLVSEYSSLEYAVVRAVREGEKFEFSGRKLGSEYSILIVAESEPVGGKFTILDAVTEGYNDLGYITDAVYTCQRSGYLVYQTQSNIINLKKITTQYDIAKASDVEQIEDETERIETLVQSMYDSLPKKEVLTDVTSGISWTNGYYINIVSGDVQSYAGLSIGIIGNVRAGDKFFISASRGMGSARALTLISSEGIVNDHCDILDYCPEEAGYFTGYYTVPYDGILVITWSGSDLSNYPVYKVTYVLTTESASPLKNVKWITLGDSLNDFNVSSANKNWIKLMIEGTSCENINLAAAGTGFYRGVAVNPGDTSANYIAKIPLIPEGAELITIAASFNDLSAYPWDNLEVGEATDTGTETIAGYINSFFDELLRVFPTVSIGVYMTAPWNSYHYGVKRSDDYVAVLKEICLIRGIPFDDSAYFGNGLKPWIEANRIKYYTRPNGTVDGVHPNNEGHKFIYRMLRPFIEKLSPRGNT